MNETNTLYEIRLPQFEGPFDLLLFFIERDELDIYDIPIAKITQDFLDYIRQMHEMDIEVASDFILFAATLMHIKAKMLLPRPELDEQGNEIDPRKELVERLLEYKLYKEASAKLQAMEEERLMKFRRGNALEEYAGIAGQISVEAEMHTVSLYRLLQVFEKVMERFRDEQSRPRHVVVQYPYTIEEQKNFLVETLTRTKEAPFEKIFGECIDRLHAIFTFLAMLELVQQQVLGIRVGVGYNSFTLLLTKDL